MLLSEGPVGLKGTWGLTATAPPALQLLREAGQGDFPLSKGRVVLQEAALAGWGLTPLASCITTQVHLPDCVRLASLSVSTTVLVKHLPARWLADQSSSGRTRGKFVRWSFSSTRPSDSNAALTARRRGS